MVERDGPLWRREERTKRETVYADGSLRANARYPGHVRSADRTYCRAHDSSGHFNISAECAEKTVERGQPATRKRKETKKKQRNEKEKKNEKEVKKREKRERGTRRPEARNRYATLPLVLRFRLRDRWSGHGEPFVFSPE